MEIDPGTFDLIQLREYQSIGINRFSLGIQAFQDNLLTLAGRSHNQTDILNAINIIQQAHCSNWSLDLISGLPQQTLRDWQTSLEMAVEFAPNHISCYDLIVENTTPFAKQYQPGIKPLPDDEITATMYRLAQGILTQAGYDHYEISNYAQRGKQCRHNRVYWQGETYYGFGMGAASYVAGKRFTRPRTRNTYYQWIKGGCVIDTLLLELDEQFLETLMLGLRLQEGLEIKYLGTRFGLELAKWTVDNLKIHQQQGWVEFIDRQGGLLPNFQKDSIYNSQQIPNSFPENLERVRLNDPEGFLFSNTILANLFNLKDELDRKNQSGELD
jgi:oxygen-independent coproporphyrinogen-3 oxidase